jgi:hypothetical protein
MIGIVKLQGGVSHCFNSIPVVLSSLLPLQHMRLSGCSLLRTPVTIVTCINASSDSPGLNHLPDYLPYICHFLWFFPEVLLTLFVFNVCTLLVFLVLSMLVYLPSYSRPVYASQIPAYVFCSTSGLRVAHQNLYLCLILCV